MESRNGPVIPVAIHEASLPDGLVAIPVRTRLIARGDDLHDVLAAALAGLARAGDVVAGEEDVVREGYPLEEHVDRDAAAKL